MASTPKGYSGVALENTSGIQQLLSATAVSSLPVSLTSSTALTAATTGMHLLIRAYNHTATGTITVAGTAVNSLAVVSETTTTIPILENPGNYADYVTSAVYGAVNASGVTLGGGLTNGSITIYGIQAAKRMVLGEFKLVDKRQEHVVPTQRADFSESHIPSLPLADDPEWEYQADLWPDSSSFIFTTGINASPTTTAIPASPVAILGATSVTTSGTVSASLQPTTPGMILVIALTGSPTTAQTVSVTGTNVYGETVTEVVVPSTKTAGTWYSYNTFASIASNGIAYGAFGGTGSITVNGQFLWQLSANTSDAPLNSFAACQYDGIGSYVAPDCITDSWELQFGEDKEAKISAKGKCQAVLNVGNFATTTSQVPALTNPLDEAITGWRGLVFIDAISGAPGTTSFGTAIEGKIACALKQKTTHTSAWNPPARWFSKVDRGRREIMVELKVYMDATTYQNEYAQAWKRGTRRLIQIQLQGLNAMGTSSGTTYSPGYTFNMPVRWVEDPTREFTLSQEFVTLTLKGRAYYDPGLGYDLNVTLNSRYQAW